MSAPSRALARLAGLRAAETHSVLVEKDVRVPAPDGTPLLTDLHLPGDGAARPTVLVRTPYGRAGLIAWTALPFAERGYNLVIQSTRGTFGSGGAVDFFHEAGDGRSVADWIVRQRWSDGTIGTFGPSYLSFTQWALASTRPPQLRAMAVQIMASERRRSYYPGGSFALDTVLDWVHAIATQERPHGQLRMLTEGRAALEQGFATLPLRDADLAVAGHEIPYYRQWLEHDAPDDPYWDALRFTSAIPSLGIPVSLLGGWYDYFLPYELDDWSALVRAGAPTQLLVGAWTHRSGRGMLVAVREALDWFDVHLRGRPRSRPAPAVRLELQPKQGWIEGDGWPATTTDRWHLHPEGRLSRKPPVASSADRYRYDPADPTPQVGGSSLSANSGSRDNRKVESRDDVLTFSSDVLAADLTVVGTVAVELYCSSSLEHFDVFARLCDVDGRGRSRNLTDGLLRIRPDAATPGDAAGGDGIRRVRFELWPTAYRFRRGHRLRLQVSSGSHPRYARNLGSGEPLATGTTLVVAEQALHHDPEHPSAIELSVPDGPYTVRR